MLLLYCHHNLQISYRSYIFQQQLAQKIRRRYLEYLCDLMKLEKKWIDDLLILQEPFHCQPNMSNIDQAFTALLKNNYGEAQAMILDYAKLSYYKVAAGCPDIVARWSRLNQCCDLRIDRNIKFNLWLLSTFHIGLDSRVFRILKKINALLGRSVWNIAFIINIWIILCGIFLRADISGRDRRVCSLINNV